MNKFLPNGTLGIALAGLLAAFMAGMAANVSSFNTVFTYDIWQTYIVKGRRDSYYLQVGRVVTVVGILIGIGTAFIASGYSNIMNYIQLLFSYFNAPLFATFIIAMFWKRMTPWAGFWGLVAGTAGAAIMHFAAYHIGYFYPDGNAANHANINAQMANFYGAIAAFVADAVVTVVVTRMTRPKPVEELQGLVYGMANVDEYAARRVHKWWESPRLLGACTVGGAAVLTIIFW
jgi:SSS family solute:Na+ symporter